MVLYPIQLVPTLVKDSGKPLPASFQRQPDYCQQQDTHMATTTVREALQFSALLRQPRTTPKAEKLEYVEEIIKLLEMEAYSDALVGEVGTGLNVEQRKRLTIGVELAAKPALLVFLDEPTSGLDSQSSWSIMLLLCKLADHGQGLPPYRPSTVRPNFFKPPIIRSPRQVLLAPEQLQNRDR
ncbi:hypothetical protein JCM5353_003416 [Sporobolomyces roseus]